MNAKIADHTNVTGDVRIVLKMSLVGLLREEGSRGWSVLLVFEEQLPWGRKKRHEYMFTRREGEKYWEDYKLGWFMDPDGGVHAACEKLVEKYAGYKAT